MLLKEQYQVLVKSLLPYAQKQLGFNRPPVINFLDDEDNSQNALGKTGFYRPDDKSISIFITNRHPKDILRSFAHEMVHHEQNLNGEVGTGKIKTTNTHEDGYLEQIERDAYEKGNIMLRKWTDSIKK